EAAVVVYLRIIHYPDGFDFPLQAEAVSTLTTELGREAATLLMLLAIGFLGGRSRIERFAYVILSFGLWDIFYYVWLKVLIDWPASLLTWDLLFLIPLPWVGPVIAPVLVSAAMIGAALEIIRSQDRGIILIFPRWAWWVQIAAGLFIIASFLWDYQNIVSGGYPYPFRWDLFSIGWLGGIALFIILILPQHKATTRKR
ncbi:MAG: hypothetical protein ABH878_05945, partial [bacterium]